MSTQEQLNERMALPALELIERALAEVRRMCQPGTHWNMTIPVDVDDSDVVITGALIAAKQELEARGVVPPALNDIKKCQRWAMREVDAPEGEVLYDGMETDDVGEWIRFHDVVALLSPRFGTITKCADLPIEQARGVVPSAPSPPPERAFAEAVARVALRAMEKYAMVLVGGFSGEPVYPEAFVAAVGEYWEHGRPRGVDSGGVAPAGPTDGD